MITFDEFQALAERRRVIPVHRKLVADGLTAVALHDQLCRGRANTFLLESAEAGAWSRYSIVGVRAEAVLTSRDGKAEWRGRELSELSREGRPLDLIREALAALETEPVANMPSFHVGLVGFMGYDMVRQLERLPVETENDLDLPELVMVLPSEIAILDHQEGELWLIANAINWDNTPERIEAAYQGAVDAVDDMERRLKEPRAPMTANPGPASMPKVRRQRTSEAFQQIVCEAQERIAAGEVLQVVVSQRFDVETNVKPFDVYRALRLTNPSPYMYFLELDGFSIVGASPEALITVRDGRATTRPIAGSRPRGATLQEDARLTEELLADEKERAEHLMLVDLGRDDLGLVSKPGTVVVEESMSIHKYSHVMHLEAAVSGELREDMTAVDAVLACFPAGTLSGAPRTRAMEIIEQLELTRRGFYGGVVGYFDFAGNADLAIAIRSAVFKDGLAHVQSGAGIVQDSVPELEDAECGHKARAVLTAIGKAASWQ